MVMRTIISILISLIAFECSKFPVDTIFFYISIALEVYEVFLHLQKKYKKRRKKQKILMKTFKPDKADTKSVNSL